MGKGKKNVIIDRIKTLAVYEVAKRMDITYTYVYMVINGTAKAGRAADVLQAYKTLYEKIEKAIS